MIASALQIPYSAEDFKLYKEWTNNRDIRKIAFANALYRVKTGGHIQAVISGEYNHGKSTTGILLAKWDTIYTRELLRYFEDPRYETLQKHLHFSIKNTVIISPKDPASKYITNPQPFRPYEIDEGYLWATTQEASEKKTTKLRDAITQNRKLAPSMYWIYPNIFKMPSIILENMMEIIHKTHVAHGIMISPSTVIQIKEKFDKAKIEKYAKKPRYFTRSMKWHSGFIFYPNFPRMKGIAWDKYLAKYEKYKIINETDDDKKKNTPKLQFFEQLDKLITKDVIRVESKNDIAKFIQNAMERESPNKHISNTVSELLANEYSEWKIEKASISLLKNLESLNIKLETKIDDLVN